ncbi:MAG: metallopeptidase family protein [Jatrophihabitantaceae bacterium]
MNVSRTGPDRTPRRRSRPRRDRRGRGVRGLMAPPDVPLSRTRAQAFDDLVLDAVEELEAHWTADLTGVEFAVEDVPPDPSGQSVEFDPEVVADRSVPLGRLHRNGVPGLPGPVIVLYRRPIEARSGETDDRGEVVFAIVAELAAEYLGKELS